MEVNRKEWVLGVSVYQAQTTGWLFLQNSSSLQHLILDEWILPKSSAVSVSVLPFLVLSSPFPVEPFLVPTWPVQPSLYPTSPVQSAVSPSLVPVDPFPPSASVPSLAVEPTPSSFVQLLSFLVPVLVDGSLVPVQSVSEGLDWELLWTVSERTAFQSDEILFLDSETVSGRFVWRNFHSSWTLSSLWTPSFPTSASLPVSESVQRRWFFHSTLSDAISWYIPPLVPEIPSWSVHSILSQESSCWWWSWLQQPFHTSWKVIEGQKHEYFETSHWPRHFDQMVHFHLTWRWSLWDLVMT